MGEGSGITSVLLCFLDDTILIKNKFICSNSVSNVNAFEKSLIKELGQKKKEIKELAQDVFGEQKDEKLPAGGEKAPHPGGEDWQVPPPPDDQKDEINADLEDILDLKGEDRKALL